MFACRSRREHVLNLRCSARRVNERSYSNKVRVFPFVTSKDKTVEYLSCNVATYTANTIFGTWLRYFFPALDVPALRPVRVQATYLPRWIVDAELGATVWSKSQDTDDHFKKNTAQVQIHQTCSTGFLYKPLSNLSLVPPELYYTKPVQWSEDMRKHEGEDVLCLPFNMDPFRVPEAIRSLSEAHTQVADVLRFEPSSVKGNMMAAYPILVPVYLAQYKIMTPINGRTRDVMITAFIEAGIPNGRLGVEVVPALEKMLSLIDMPAPDMMLRGPHAMRMMRFVTVRSLIARHTLNSHRTYIEEWANEALWSGIPQEHYFKHTLGSAGAKSVDWSDERIRPFDSEERIANAKYMAASADLALLRTMRQVYDSLREVRCRPFRRTVSNTE
ncbi:hypothetical protein BC628DRAFT_1308651 [Trametes gibbosa]|nr:hypothetical protein BC628DRAFT_1307426 [Trametes gibbosa]KAI0833505.1 hypothetical protein BC628DRAFT_1308651 [Trametes gibbosa]